MAARIDDALMFRETDKGEAWDVIRIPAGRIAHLEAMGWTVLISSAPLDRDIAATFAADVARFSPQRRR